MNNTSLLILLIVISGSIALCCITLTGIAVYNIYKDRVSKENLFEIQIASAQSLSLKDAPPPKELYQFIDDTIRFYTYRQLLTTDLSTKSEQELSLLLDDIVETIVTNVEYHLSDQIKRTWETYFDKIPTEKGAPPSHLNLYIYDNTKIILVRAIESMKANSKDGNLTRVEKKSSSNSNNE